MIFWAGLLISEILIKISVLNQQHSVIDPKLRLKTKVMYQIVSIVSPSRILIKNILITVLLDTRLR